MFVILFVAVASIRNTKQQFKRMFWDQKNFNFNFAPKNMPDLRNRMKTWSLFFDKNVELIEFERTNGTEPNDAEYGNPFRWLDQWTAWTNLHIHVLNVIMRVLTLWRIWMIGNLGLTAACEMLAPNDDRVVLLSSISSLDTESSDLTSTISSFILTRANVRFVCFLYRFRVLATKTQSPKNSSRT